MPPLTSLSPAFPLRVGTQFPTVGVYCEMSSCSVTAQIFGAGYFRLPRCFCLLLLPLQLLIFVHSGPSFLCPVSCYSFSFCSFCIFFFHFSTYILFSFSHFIHSAWSAGLHCFFLILPDQSTAPSCHLNKGNPGHTDIVCKSSCKHGNGKYSEQNKQQRQWGQSEVVSLFSSPVTSF